MDTRVLVKSIPPDKFPAWIYGGGRLLHPELHFSKPAKYDLRSLVCLEDRETRHFEYIGDIYRSFESKGLLVRALSYSDLKAISAKGLATFNSLFPGKLLLAFRSAVDLGGELLVPCIFGGVNCVCEIGLYGDFLLIEEHPILGFPEVEAADPVLETDCGIAP